MRYMPLIYSQESDSATAAELQQVAAAHQAVMEQGGRRGIFVPPTPSNRQPPPQSSALKGVTSFSPMVHS
jgi:hypothetical protein